jgi:hypothetical protein
MVGTRLIAGGLFAAALIAGALAPGQAGRPAVVADGFQVLAADLHVHSFPLSWGALAPWDMVLEARRQGLDAIAMAGHNHVWTSKLARWFAERIGGPTVIVSEEIAAHGFHLIAVGIDSPIGWRQSAAAAIDHTHRQGGVAIAAHPVKSYWPGYEAALPLLDGSEVCRPLDNEARHTEVRAFFQRGSWAAIGSSDQRGLAGQDFCRTYIFARGTSTGAILEALREHRTVVFDRDGTPYGDPRLIPLLHPDAPVAPAGWLAVFSRWAGIAALAMALVWSRVRE